MTQPSFESIRAAIRQMFTDRGDPPDVYRQGRFDDAGEPVTQTQHALQCAHFAQQAGPPPRLHVAAKRYRCAIDSEYLSQLSNASVLSLKLQGGPMSPEEQHTFREHPQWRDALRLRLWDEAAKDPKLSVAPFGRLP